MTVQEQLRHAYDSVTRGPLLEKAMTFAYLGLFAFQYIGLFSTGDMVAFFEFVALVPAFFIICPRIYSVFERFALYLNENVFTSGLNVRVFDDKKRLQKFCDQGWQCIVHMLAVAFEVPTVLGEGLFQDPSRCFEPCPRDQTFPNILKFAYMFELVAYTYSGFHHRFLMQKKRDYYIMFAHHIATCALIIGSYLTGAIRGGVLIMFMHDWSDVVFDWTQMFNHAHMEGGEFYFVMEILFLSAMGSWFYSRIYYLPFQIIRSIFFDLHRACAVKFPGQPWKHPHCEGSPFWGPAIVLLSILVVMHCYWFYLFCLVLVKVVVGDTNKGDVYEGDPEEIERQKQEAKKAKKAAKAAKAE
jgi:hypothetical protein